MPFVRKPGERPSPPPPSHGLDDRFVLPFRQQPRMPAEPDPGRTALTLDQYASLAAELAVEHEPTDAIAARYGLPGASMAEEHARWAKLLDEDRATKIEYEKKVRTFTSWLRQRR
jgi:hypothetical protein